MSCEPAATGLGCLAVLSRAIALGRELDAGAALFACLKMLFVRPAHFHLMLPCSSVQQKPVVLCSGFSQAGYPQHRPLGPHANLGLRDS